MGWKGCTHDVEPPVVALLLGSMVDVGAGSVIVTTAVVPSVVLVDKVVIRLREEVVGAPSVVLVAALVTVDDVEEDVCDGVVLDDVEDEDEDEEEEEEAEDEDVAEDVVVALEVVVEEVEEEEVEEEDVEEVEDVEVSLVLVVVVLGAEVAEEEEETGSLLTNEQDGHRYDCGHLRKKRDKDCERR